MISLIWAMDEYSLIGDGDKLPWHIPSELQYFKETTMGHPIVMGRKTFESIGKPLPGRTNIIITRNRDYKRDDCIVLHTIDDLLSYVEQYRGEVFVIGGAQVYETFLRYARRLYFTQIHDSFIGDTYFPAFVVDGWDLIKTEKVEKSEDNEYSYTHYIYEKKMF